MNIEKEIAQAMLAAEARADMIDALIDRYMSGEANRFSLPIQTITWLRVQPEYQARYRQEVEHD